MSRNLTKNARWVLFWARYVSEDAPLSLPVEMTFNCGRHPYSVPTMEAITGSLNFDGEKVLASMVYEVDVALYPYTKQWEEVSALAESWFAKSLTKEAR